MFACATPICTGAIRTQVRARIETCWREQALSNYRRAYDLYAEQVKTTGDRNARLTQRVDCGNACARLIARHTATADEQQWHRGYPQLLEQLAEQQFMARPGVVECEG